jgi:hypothetical protein
MFPLQPVRRSKARFQSAILTLHIFRRRLSYVSVFYDRTLTEQDILHASSLSVGHLQSLSLNVQVWQPRTQPLKNFYRYKIGINMLEAMKACQTKAHKLRCICHFPRPDAKSKLRTEPKPRKYAEENEQ